MCECCVSKAHCSSIYITLCKAFQGSTLTINFWLVHIILLFTLYKLRAKCQSLTLKSLMFQILLHTLPKTCTNQASWCLGAGQRARLEWWSRQWPRRRSTLCPWAWWRCWWPNHHHPTPPPFPSGTQGWTWGLELGLLRSQQGLLYHKQRRKRRHS